MLVFYNDNKASFQQFVEMMRKEFDRQHQEDMQMLVASVGVSNEATQNKQPLINNEEQKSKIQKTEIITAEDSLQREGISTTGSEYDDNNDLNALRLVFKFIKLLISFKLQNISSL